MLVKYDTWGTMEEMEKFRFFNKESGAQMPENPLEEARFDRVGRDGTLIFAARGSRFAVPVDETLERAILEAKQIMAESLVSSQPQHTQSLPISQIQALIRAGADPSRIAERYKLSETLVRRFSTAVETEKQYAIEQFLSIAAPKESRVHSIAELIERTLASARIGMESVSWKATRRGLEPWKITARFESAGRQARAEWSWNMHDNSITCLNPAAKKLLGERDETKGASRSDAEGSDAGHDGFPMAITIPGDSVRSARIERTVSAWSEIGGTDVTQTDAHVGDGDVTPTMRTAADETGRSGERRITNGRERLGATGDDRRRGKAASDDDARTDDAGDVISIDALASLASVSGSPHRDGGRRSSETRQDSSSPRTSDTSGSEAGPASLDEDDDSTRERSTDAASHHHGHDAATRDTRHSDGGGKADAADLERNDQKPSKRKSGRSAVPSWDEILFGD